MGRRSYFERALAREELSRACIYLLIESAGADDLPEIYVGESDDFVQRYASAPFPIPFDSFIVFTNKDDNLTRAHVKWLELEIWIRLKQNEGKVTVANRSRPTGSKLSEAETASMGTFLDNMTYVLGALGFEFFGLTEKSVPQDAESVRSVSPTSTVAQSFFTTATPRSESAKAYLDMVGDSFVLRAGSLISATATDSLPANVGRLRNQLLNDKQLVAHCGCLRLGKDITFTSPSPASALVKGRSSTGHGDWMRISDRLKLGEVLKER